MLDHIKSGYQVAMTYKEADGLAGGSPRIVSCENGRIIGGYGSIGLVEHTGDTDIEAMLADLKQKREQLRQMAAQQPECANPREHMFAFTRI